MKKVEVIHGSSNVFADIGFPAAEAENLLRRTDLMIEVEKWFRRSALSQQVAAARLGITQPRLNQLLKGKIGLFSIDALVNMLARAGLKVRITVTGRRVA